MFVHTDVVDTGQGCFRGTAEGDIERFLGIAFAAAPVGPLRWALPQPVEPHTGIVDASDFGPDCPQAAMRHSRASVQHEDCLRLNIWRPREKSADPLPVYLWFHGGGFAGGSGSDARTDGRVLAARGMIVVAANYRTGIFGYFAHPALSAEGNGASGNYGLHDNVAALRWVHANIAAFGGDPARITLGGVSAGGASVALLLMTSVAREGLFHQLILESPGAMRPLAPLALAEAEGSEIAINVERLRHASADELLLLSRRYTDRPRSATRARTLRPIIDGHLIREDERTAHLAGRTMAFPMIIGSNLDEGAQLAKPAHVATTQAYHDFLIEQFGRHAPAAARLYPADSPGQIQARLADIFADTQFTYGVHALARSSVSRAPVWRYLFAFRSEGVTAGPFHGDEPAFAFGLPAMDDEKILRASGPDADALTEMMSAMWSRLIIDGDPGWPRCEGEKQIYRLLDGGDATGSEWRQDQMELLDSFYDLNRSL